MGPQMIPLIISAVGTAAQMSAQQDQADEKRSTLNRQLARDDDASKKAVDLVQNEGQNFSMENRLKQMKEQEDQNFNQTQTDIAGAGGANFSSAGDAGNVSDDFIKGKAARAVDEGTRLTSIAREAAKTRSAGGLMNNDALRKAGLAGSLQNVWGTNANMGRATQNDAASVQEPGYGTLGTLASAIGNGMAAQSATADASGVSWDPDGSYARKYARVGFGGGA